MILRAVDFFAGAFLAVAFFAGAFLAAVFLAVVVFAVVFLAAAVFATVFFAAVFFTAAVVFFATVFFAAIFLTAAFLAVVAFLAAAFFTVAEAPPERLPFGAFLTATSCFGSFFEPLTRSLKPWPAAEARHRGLLDPNTLTRLRVAGVTGGAVDLLEGTEARDRDPVSADNRTDDGVQYSVDRVGGLLTPADLVGNRFYELRLVHVFPFGDIARTNAFKLFRTLGRYIPQIKHETG